MSDLPDSEVVGTAANHPEGQGFRVGAGNSANAVTLDSQPPRRKPPWPWLAGGLGIGVITGVAVGVAVAPYAGAFVDSFRPPGWGWAAYRTFARMLS